MGDLSIALIVCGALIGLMLLGVNIGVALGVSAFIGTWIILNLDVALGVLSGIPYDFAASWKLSSIPMFLFMGYLCYHAKLTDGLFRAARLWLSNLPGGLAISSIGAAAGFSAVTGSSVACAAAMGRIAVPEMLKSGYDKGLASGVVAAAGTIGSLIPPSILLLLYGIFAQVPIGQLFLGGVGPGILTALLYSLMIILRVRANPRLAPRVVESISWRDRFSALVDVWPVLAIAAGVFAGLFAGLFTPTEAGAIGASLSLILALARRTLTRAGFLAAVKETVWTTAAIFVIAIGAHMLTRFLALAGLADALAGLVVDTGFHPLIVMAGMAVIYLILGMFLDPIGIMLLTLPIFLPVVEALDIDLIWFGVLVTKYLEIALITPPVGLNVFVIKGVVGKEIPTSTIFHGILWFIVADLGTITLMLLIPEIVVALPNAFW
ncbi:TRAP transporter large permease [Actibacterium sp.]|uniref:TRAP transporter large permease n=1 Tax=Actibacterium sp. TaxID=1872125 RepID=UPI003564FCE2